MKNQEKTLTRDQILADAIALAPTIVECRDEIERERRLPMHLVDAMKKAGVFRIARPGEWGGKQDRKKLIIPDFQGSLPATLSDIVAPSQRAAGERLVS